MDRSIYPEGVEVGQSALANTESTRSFHIRQRHKDDSSLGVVSGFTVTPNTTDGTLIDVLAGVGYAPEDEYVELTASQTGIALSDYTSGTVNLVLAVYTEINTNTAAHETNGNSPATRAERSVRIVVLTQSEFNLLPQTDTNLSNDDKDRSLILARVTAQGAGVSLTSGNITNATEFGSALAATKASNNITGATIVSIDKTSNTGNGTLTFTFSSVELAWTAPGDSIGTAINVAVSGEYVLASADGTTITILVASASLPTSDQTDTVVVANIYSQTVNSHTPRDLQHRAFIGSGVPTSSNPHGLTLADLGGGDTSVEEHQDLFHSNGIRLDSSASLLILAATVDTGEAPDELDFTVPTAGEQIYLNGVKHTSLASNTVQFTDIADDRHAVFDIYVVEGSNEIASLEKKERIRYATIPAPTLSDALQLVDVSENMPSGTGEIDVTSGVEPGVSFRAPGDPGFGRTVFIPIAGPTPTKMRLYNETGEYYVDVLADVVGSFTLPDTENVVISDRPTALQLEARTRVATVMFSGSATGFLGNGFGAGNSPNTVTDQRLFGLTGPTDLRDDVNFFSENVSVDLGVTFPQDMFPDTIARGMSTNNWLAIGHTKPGGQLHIANTDIQEPTKIVADYYGIIGRPLVLHRAAEGTPSAPTIVIAGKALGSMNWAGYDGDNFILSASITALVEGTPASNVIPSRLLFQTANSSGILTNVGRFDSNGTFVVGTGAATNSDIAIEIGGSRALKVAVMTTATRDGLSATTGMVIYNSTTDSLQVVNNANAWKDVP